MSETLEQILADRREEAAILRSHGHSAQAKSIEAVCDDVAKVMRGYLTILSEKEAMLRSGRGVDFFRSRFPEWESAGFALLDEKGRRVYRESIVPTRAQNDAARLAGERGERLRSHAS